MQAQQWDIEGIVQDKNKTFLSYATVYAQSPLDSNSNILAFSTTDDNGFFQLNINDSIAEVIIICNYLGKKKYKTTANQNTTFPILITMVAQDNDLSEVIVSDKKLKINTRGDTIIYNASEFRDSTEVTVEDLLKKLPGVEVAENGQISVGGKPIKKMLIEGTDMFGRQYTVGSQNLRADFISSVEIIDHYQENQVIKDIVSSEDIVLNLKLKEKVKNILSGVLSFGVGYGDEAKGAFEANAFLISKKRKLLLISNDGNTGIQYGIDELSYVYDNGGSDWSDEIQLKPTFTQSVQSNYLNFNKTFIDNSKSSFTTLRNFFDIGNVKLKVNGTYAYQQDAQKSINQTSYIYQQEVFENNLEQNQNFKNNLGKIDFKLNYVNPKATQSFDFTVAYDQGNHRAFQASISSNDTIENNLRRDLNLNNQKVFAAASYTLKLGEKSALFLSTKNSLIILPESFRGNNPDFNFLHTFNTPFDSIYQDLNFKNQLHQFSTTYIHNINRWSVKVNSTLLSSTYSLSNSWLPISENVTSQEEYTQKATSQKDLTWENALVISRKINGSAMLNTKISNFYRVVNIADQVTRFSAKDNFSFHLWLNKQYQNKLKLWLSYAFQNDNLVSSDFLPVSFIQSSFGFQNNIIKNQTPQGHQFSARISRNNTYKLTNFYIGSKVGFRQQQWASNFRFYHSIVSSQPYFISNNNYFRIYGMWEKFLPKAKTNLEVKPSIMRSQATQIIGEEAIRTNSSNLALQIKLSWRVHSSTLLSLESQVGRRTFKTKSQPTSQFSNLRLSPFLSYKFKGWKTKTSVYYYKSFAANQNVSLLGSKFRLEKTVSLKNWKPNLSLEFNNLFNTKWYNTILNSENFTFIDNVEAIPPFFVFSFDYTF